MTVETTTPVARYPISSIGPYGIEWPYFEDSHMATLEVDGVQIPVDAAFFSISPTSSLTGGNLFLDYDFALANAGRQLIVQRTTVAEQGWQGTQGEREAGLERQLDRLTMQAQETAEALLGSLRVLGRAVPPVLLADDQTIIWKDGAFQAGPTGTEISNAQANSEAAKDAAEAAKNSADLVLSIAAGYIPITPNSPIISDGTLTGVVVSGVYTSPKQIMIWIGGSRQAPENGFYTVAPDVLTTTVTFAEAIPAGLQVSYEAKRQVATPVADPIAIAYPDGSTGVDLWRGATPYASLAAFNAADIPASTKRAWVLASIIPSRVMRVLSFVAQEGAAVTGLKVGWVPDGDVFAKHFGAAEDYDWLTGTDDTTAIQAALAYVSSKGGGIVYVDGLSLTSARISIPRDCHLMPTNPAGDTVEAQYGLPSWPPVFKVGSAIVASHLSGPAVLLSESNSTIGALFIGATQARYNAPISTGAQNVNSGVSIETADNVNAVSASNRILGAIAYAQPADGFYLAGHLVSWRLESLNALQCGRHGYAVEAGYLSGRTNKYAPGIGTIHDFRGINLGGHGEVIGHPSAGVVQPYRIGVTKTETFRVGNVPGLLFKSSCVYFTGEQLTFWNCGWAATSGYTGDTPTLQHSVAIGGRNNSINGSRFVRAVNEPVLVLDTPYALPSVTTLSLMRSYPTTPTPTATDLVKVDAGSPILYVTDCESGSALPSRVVNPATFTGSGVVNTLGNSTFLGNSTTRGASTFNGSATFNDAIIQPLGPTLTISSGTITITRSVHGVDTEAAAASGELHTINGGVIGQILVLGSSTSARVTTIKNATGNIRCGVDRVLRSSFDRIVLRYNGTYWVLVSFSGQDRTQQRFNHSSVKARFGPATIAAGTGTLAVTADLLYFWPVLLPEGLSPDRLEWEITTGVAGNARIGVYDHNYLVQGPGNLIYDSGDVSTAAAAVLTQNLIALSPRRIVWIAATFSAAPTVRAGSALSNGFLGGTNLTTATAGYSVARAYAALPADASALAYSLTGTRLLSALYTS